MKFSVLSSILNVFKRTGKVGSTATEGGLLSKVWKYGIGALNVATTAGCAYEMFHGSSNDKSPGGLLGNNSPFDSMTESEVTQGMLTMIMNKISLECIHCNDFADIKIICRVLNNIASLCLGSSNQAKQIQGLIWLGTSEYIETTPLGNKFNTSILAGKLTSIIDSLHDEDSFTDDDKKDMTKILGDLRDELDQCKTNDAPGLRTIDYLCSCFKFLEDNTITPESAKKAKEELLLINSKDPTLKEAAAKAKRKTFFDYLNDGVKAMLDPSILTYEL